MPPRTRAQRAAAESKPSPFSKPAGRRRAVSSVNEEGQQRPEEEGVEEEGMYLFTTYINPRLVLLAVAAVGLALLAYRIVQCPFDPVVWEDPPPLAELAGPGLAPNFDLAGAEHLFRHRLVGPESMAFGGHGEIYLRCVGSRGGLCVDR